MHCLGENDEQKDSNNRTELGCFILGTKRELMNEFLCSNKSLLCGLDSPKFVAGAYFEETSIPNNL